MKRYRYKVEREKVRKPFWGSPMFKWAEDSRYNRTLTDKSFILMLNRSRLGFDSNKGNHVERWLTQRYERMARGELR